MPLSASVKFLDEDLTRRLIVIAEPKHQTGDLQYAFAECTHIAVGAWNQENGGYCIRHMKAPSHSDNTKADVHPIYYVTGSGNRTNALHASVENAIGYSLAKAFRK